MRSAAAAARSAASHPSGRPHRSTRARGRKERSDLWGLLTDELADVARGDENGVDSRPFEREHFLARRDVDVRDRELPRRHVREELEDRVQRVGVVVAVPDREQEDLGVELLERALELVLVADRHDVLDVARRRLVVGPDRVRVRVDGLAAADPQQGESRCLADAGDRAVDRERLRALLLGGARGRRVADADDDGDAVALRDPLAESSFHGRDPGTLHSVVCVKRRRCTCYATSIVIPSYAGSHPSRAPRRTTSSCVSPSMCSMWDRTTRRASSARATPSVSGYVASSRSSGWSRWI